MKTNIIKIGNSKGVIIPSSWLNLLEISDKGEVLLDMAKGVITIKKNTTRDGWEDAAIRMRKNNDDKLLIDDVFDDENFEDWV